MTVYDSCPKTDIKIIKLIQKQSDLTVLFLSVDEIKWHKWVAESHISTTCPHAEIFKLENIHSLPLKQQITLFAIKYDIKLSCIFLINFI